MISASLRETHHGWRGIASQDRKMDRGDPSIEAFHHLHLSSIASIDVFGMALE
jgi:hypothetical protein|tara:strand:+ start:241 stop:399 length:159 start_codon:yes stop_codon:yes gene_type:complete